VESGAYGKSFFANQCAAWLLLWTKAEREPLVVCGALVKRWSTAGVICLLLYSFGCLLYSFGMSEQPAYSFGDDRMLTDGGWSNSAPFISSQRRTEVL
jgi:hypothetical protein